MKDLKETRLNYPSVNTWFICWNDNKKNITAYDLVMTSQCMVTPWDEVDYYTDEQEWLKVLLNNNIIPGGE
jgi:hypothetical protein|tara:strand:- start:58 stop:270 length:213 start_codon:yes stop_codon:yes gene_type:complete